MTEPFQGPTRALLEQCLAWRVGQNCLLAAGIPTIIDFGSGTFKPLTPATLERVQAAERAAQAVIAANLDEGNGLSTGHLLTLRIVPAPDGNLCLCWGAGAGVGKMKAVLGW